MALVSFNTFVSEVAPHISGCPTSVIEAYIRKVVTDLCERAGVWTVRATAIPLIAGDYAYNIPSPIANTEVVSVIKLSITPASTGKPVSLAPKTLAQAVAEFPAWPEDGDQAQPTAYVAGDFGLVELYKIPDAADSYVMNAQVSIRPSAAATECDDSLLSAYRRAIFHGVLHELMLLPDRVWSDAKTATMHGRQWEYFLYLARAKVNKGFGRGDLAVKLRPWA